MYISSITLLFLQSSSPQPAFILQPTSLVTQAPKTREPPRYEEAIKQSRNLHVNNVSQVRCTPATEHTPLDTTQAIQYIFPAVLSCCILQNRSLFFGLVVQPWGIVSLLVHQLQVSQPCWLSFQVPTATSQQMDDLFDILIESGGKEVHADGTNPEHCV